MITEIRFPGRWVDENRFEEALKTWGSPHELMSSKIVFVFPAGCKIMIGTAVRLLSLANQLNFTSKRVELIFEEVGFGAAIGYLGRMSFFDHLAQEVTVFPERPAVSEADLYRGTNRTLVEIQPINKDVKDMELPTSQ